MIDHKIYVPNITDYKCFVVQNADTIRAYKNIPITNSEVVYRDYFINSHYVFKDGIQTFGNYGYSTLPVCMDANDLTTSIYHRNDFDSILVIFFIIILFAYFILKKVIRGFFLGFKYC